MRFLGFFFVASVVAIGCGGSVRQDGGTGGSGAQAGKGGNAGSGASAGIGGGAGTGAVAGGGAGGGVGGSGAVAGGGAGGFGGSGAVAGGGAGGFGGNAGFGGGVGCCAYDSDCPQWFDDEPPSGGGSGGTPTQPPYTVECVNGMCVNAPPPGQCWSDLDCPFTKCIGGFVCPCGAACSQENTIGWCEGPPPPPPEPGCCKIDWDCGDFMYVPCVSGVCKQPVVGKCWTDAECSAGQKCVGASVCPCGYDCGLIDQPGTCQG